MSPGGFKCSEGQEYSLSAAASLKWLRGQQTLLLLLLQGWSQLDDLRRKLEDLRELRDLVRSLGRGGGWGPLR